MDPDREITATADVPDQSTYLFYVYDLAQSTDREAILVRTDDSVTGWMNYCQHLIDIRLDRGRGAVLRGDEILCENHGAMFEIDTGYCTHGPCRGASLEPIEVSVVDDIVILSDDNFELIGQDRPRFESRDRSTRNIDF